MWAYMDKHIDVASPHCEAMPDFRFLEWQLDDQRRQADDVRREKYKAACKRFDRHRKAWLTGYSLFSFGELADVYVSRMPIGRDRDQGREKFFELLRASIAVGGFVRGGRPRISVISPDGVYRLSTELMEAGDGDAMQSLLEQCWTLPAIGIEWCGRLEIELPDRWKERTQVSPAERTPTSAQIETKIIAFIDGASLDSPQTLTSAKAILSVFRTQPDLVLKYRKKALRKEISDYCTKEGKSCPSDKTIYNVLERIRIG